MCPKFWTGALFTLTAIYDRINLAYYLTFEILNTV